MRKLSHSFILKITKKELTSDLKFPFQFSLYLIEYDSTQDLNAANGMSRDNGDYTWKRDYRIFVYCQSVIDSLCLRVGARQPQTHTPVCDTEYRYADVCSG